MGIRFGRKRATSTNNPRPAIGRVVRVGESGPNYWARLPRAGGGGGMASIVKAQESGE